MKPATAINDGRTALALGLFVTIVAGVSCLYPVWIAGADGATRQLADDYFYYLKIADNLRTRHISTYNGIAITNGYHPLWLLTTWALLLVTGPIGIRFYVAFLALLSLLLGVTAFLAYHTCVSLGTGRPGALFAATAVAFYLWRIAHGMEVTLAAPLFLGFLLYICLHPLNVPRRAFIAGLLGSAAVLARLDAATLVGSVMVAELVFTFPPSARQARPALTLACCLGMSPVLAYLVANRFFYGHFLPLSAVAKSARGAGGLTAEALAGLFFFNISDYITLKLPRLVATWLCLICVVVGTVRVFLRRSQREDRLILAVAFGALIFAVSQYALTDYSSLGWPWYQYQFAITLGLCTAWLLKVIPLAIGRQRMRVRATLAWVPAAIVAIVFLVSSYRAAMAAAHDGIYVSRLTRQAHTLQRFEQTNPGVYAMGDGAGLPGLMLSSPIVQLEGLVMDDRFIDHLRRGSRLEDVFSRYKVDFYVTINRNFWLHDGCYDVFEPAIAGPVHANMRARLCSTPRLISDGVLVFGLRSPVDAD
jgi:hypothetical protein